MEVLPFVRPLKLYLKCPDTEHYLNHEVFLERRDWKESVNGVRDNLNLFYRNRERRLEGPDFTSIRQKIKNWWPLLPSFKECWL